MKAIETRYKNHRFRSRLEARWAVFFDAMGMPWEYESEGYELKNGVRYLPDFLLDGTVFVEIKPNVNTSDAPLMDRFVKDKKKWESFAPEIGDREFLVMLGAPGDHESSGGGVEYFADGHFEIVTLAECRRCGGLSWLNRHMGAVEHHAATLKCDAYCKTERWPIVGSKIEAAVRAARSARFEHGERGASEAEETLRDARRLLGAGADSRELIAFLGTIPPETRA